MCSCAGLRNLRRCSRAIRHSSRQLLARDHRTDRIRSGPRNAIRKPCSRAMLMASSGARAAKPVGQRLQQRHLELHRMRLAWPLLVHILGIVTIIQ